MAIKYIKTYNRNNQQPITHYQEWIGASQLQVLSYYEINPVQIGNQRVQI